MTQFLIRCFIKRPDDVKDAAVRTAYGNLASLVGMSAYVEQKSAFVRQHKKIVLLAVSVLAWAGSLLGFIHVSLLAATTAGACVGFLLWNFYPAKVFMGDTGSMFFGGMVTALAFVMDRPELVLFFGIVYIWDAMTVVIQRIYFKATHGKRIFKMTPIHHAFELRGWKEVKIDGFFALIAAIGVAMGIFYICIA